MNIVIRGHIRNAFETEELYELLRCMADKHDIKIFIHTWDKKQNTLSWRHIEEDSTPVTTELIRAYFKDIFDYVQNIIIEPDSDIKIHGNIEGKLASSRTSLLGWKRYIFGNYRVIKHIYDISGDKDEFVLNMRFDLFTNSFVFPYDEITKFIDTNYGIAHNNNVFMREGYYCGVDNIIIGSIKSQYTLISTIHLHLDDILKEYNDLKNPEFVIPIVNDMICRHTIK